MQIRCPYSNYEDLLDGFNTDEESILKLYASEYINTKTFFRIRSTSDDKAPSCRAAYVQGKLFMNDFGNPDFKGKSKSILGFIMYKYNLNSIDALDKLYYDLISNKVPFSTVTSTSKKKPLEAIKKTIIRVKYDKWNNETIKYWNNLHITLDMLDNEFNTIKPVKYYWINDFMIEPEGICFAFYYGEHYGVHRFKIYRPYSDKYKWFSNCTSNIVQNGLTLPQEGNLLVLQSSHKDCLVMNAMNYVSWSPITESVILPERKINKYKENFKNVVYFANNDWNKKLNSGIKYAENLYDAYQIPYVTTEPIEGVSDISDLVLIKGFNYAKTYVDLQLSEIIGN